MNAEERKAIEDYAHREKEQAELAKGKAGLDGVYMLHLGLSEGARAALTIADWLVHPLVDPDFTSAVNRVLRSLGWVGSPEDVEKIAQGMYQELALLGKEEAPSP